MAGFLDTLFGGGAQKDAAQQDIGTLQQYSNQALPALTSAYNTGTTAINQGIGAYQPLAQLGSTYAQGASPYMAALGVGTPDQLAQAQSTFQNLPGNAAARQNAFDAVARQRAIGGMGASGNADIDQILGQAGITSQQYQNYVNNLQNSQGLAAGTTGAAAAGQAAGYNNLAGLAQNYGQSQANVYGNVAQGTIGANNLAAAGESQGAKNLLGAGLSLASLAAGGVGGGLGGSLGTSLLSGLGQGSSNFGLGGSQQFGNLNIGGYQMPTAYNPYQTG